METLPVAAKPPSCRLRGLFRGIRRTASSTLSSVSGAEAGQVRASRTSSLHGFIIGSCFPIVPAAFKEDEVER